MDNKIPDNLKVLMRRSYLPLVEKTPGLKTVVFIMNEQDSSLKSILDNKLILDNNKILYTFRDPLLDLKMGTRQVKVNLRKERDQYYSDTVALTGKRLKGVTHIDNIHEKNLYVPLSHILKAFYSNTTHMTYIKRVDEFFNVISKYVNSGKFEPYENKLIILNLDELALLDKVSNIDNPILYMRTSMIKNIDTLSRLKGIKILLTSNTGYMYLYPEKCDSKSIYAYKRGIVRLSKNFTLIEDDAEIERLEKNNDNIVKIASNLKEEYNLVGAVDDEKLTPIIKKITKDKDNVTMSDVVDGIDKTDEILGEISTLIKEKKVGKSKASSKRDEELKKKQFAIKLKDKSIEDLFSLDTRKLDIEEDDVSSVVRLSNPSMGKIRFKNFEKQYNEEVIRKDISNMLLALNDKDLPVFIKDIEIEDTSDELNLKETYKITLEDGNRVRHNLKVDVPLFIDDKFVWLRGNRKIINKQLFLKPIVKTEPDSLKVCSNYNKMLMSIFGTKLSTKIEKLKKFIALDSGISYKLGNHFTANLKYQLPLEYSELSKIYTSLETSKIKYIFSQKTIEELGLVKKPLKDSEICIGYKKPSKEPIILDILTNKIDDNDLVDYLIASLPQKSIDAFSELKAGKKYKYTKAKVMEKEVPLILLLSYWEGITTVLRKANVPHYFSETRPRINHDEQAIVDFSDGYLVYDKYPLEHSLLMNGLGDIPTKTFTYADLDERETYGEILEMMYNTKSDVNSFLTFYEFMIDPITKEVLEDLDYPTDLVSLLIYANTLLTDNTSLKEYDMNIYRVRSNELVSVFLYKKIAHAYSQYRQTSNNRNPVKMSIRQDAITKELLTGQTIEDYPTLNPIVELEKSRTISPKGPQGLNKPRAYTEEKRSFHKSMIGVIGMSTSPDANVGVIRQMSLEPNIKGVRGYIDVKDDNLDDVKDVNAFTPAELLSPLGVTKDDPTRTAMASKQSKHIIPVKKSSPVLISNGAEKIIHYNLTSDFVITAKEDGVVKEVNTSTGIVILEYKSGEKHAFDTSPKMAKNGAGGFYLCNTLTCHFKEGQKFKKYETIASDSNFFSSDSIEGNRFNIGSLQKIACMSTYSTFDDSCFVTNKMSREMSSKLSMPKEVVLGKNASVDYIVEVGQEIKVGDELIRFEMSFEEESVNKLLSSIGDDLKEDIKSLSKHPIKSKYAGKIVDIKMYSTVDLDELSPSLRKIFEKYYKQLKSKRSVLNKHVKSDSVYKMNMMLNEPIGKVNSPDGKIKGHEVGEGVLIEFYIEYVDLLAIGDKVTYFTALKSTIGDVIPEGLEPFSEFRPDEEISSTLAPGAVLARMTPSILITMFGNKVLVELKRKMYEKYYGKEWRNTK